MSQMPEEFDDSSSSPQTTKTSLRTSRQSHRIKKRSNKVPGIPYGLPTPCASPSPSLTSSRASSPHPKSVAAENHMRSEPVRATFSAPAPPSTIAAIATSDTNASGIPTLNWDCVSYMTSDQKIHSTYEKPNTVLGTDRVSSYRRMVTTTTTTTVTTTIATTDILLPEDAGYAESIERQKAQAEASPQDRLKLEKRIKECRIFSAGSTVAHDGYHRCHHSSAIPAKDVLSTA